MKVYIDNELIFELSDIQKKVIMNDINADEFDADMKRRLEYILMHKYQKSFDRLEKEWCCDDGTGNSKLSKNGVNEIPMEKLKLAELIMKQPNYKDRKAREIEEKEKIN